MRCFDCFPPLDYKSVVLSRKRVIKEQKLCRTGRVQTRINSLETKIEFHSGKSWSTPKVFVSVFIHEIRACIIALSFLF